MVESINKDQVNTFPVPFTLGEIKENFTVTASSSSKPSKVELINQLCRFHLQGNIQEAELAQRKAIEINTNVA